MNQCWYECKLLKYLYECVLLAAFRLYFITCKCYFCQAVLQWSYINPRNYMGCLFLQITCKHMLKVVILTRPFRINYGRIPCTVSAGHVSLVLPVSFRSFSRYCLSPYSSPSSCFIVFSLPTGILWPGVLVCCCVVALAYGFALRFNFFYKVNIHSPC